jgi:PAS domain S-box-containing protein
MPANDAKRVAALDSFHIMDSEHETSFDELAWLAAHSCGSRFAQINFVHSARVWTKANVGFPETEQRRNVSPCSYVVSASDMVVIPDTYEDDRTSLCPIVIQGPRIRFYAAVPLLTRDGYAIGTLCVMDTDPRTLTVSQGGSLWAVSRQVMANLNARDARTAAEHSTLGEDDGEERARLHAERIASIAEQMPAILWTTDTQLRFTTTLGSAMEPFHMRPTEVMGKTLQEYFGTDDPAFAPIAAHIAALRGDTPGPLRWSGWGHTLEVRITQLRSKDGEITGCLGMALDITERVNIDRAADRVRDDFRVLVDAASRAVPIDGHEVVDSTEGSSPGADSPTTDDVIHQLNGMTRRSA